MAKTTHESGLKGLLAVVLNALIQVSKDGLAQEVDLLVLIR
jgi:hypothetical protein